MQISLCIASYYTNLKYINLQVFDSIVKGWFGLPIFTDPAKYRLINFNDVGGGYLNF